MLILIDTGFFTAETLRTQRKKYSPQRRKGRKVKYSQNQGWPGYFTADSRVRRAHRKE
jgi:hypothetical protein